MLGTKRLLAPLCVLLSASLVCSQSYSGQGTVLGNAIPVGESNTLSTVNVDVSVSSIDGVAIKGLYHTWAADLDFYLIAPNGIEYILAQHAPLGSSDHVNNDYAFVAPGTPGASAYAGNPIPFSGVYVQFGLGLSDLTLNTLPLGPISPGPWTLRVRDSCNCESQSYYGSWTLSVNSFISLVDEWCVVEQVCPPECTQDSHCTDPEPGCGPANVCVECTQDSHCSGGDWCLVNVCIAPVCGDSLVRGGEECDDGNTVDGDGCSSTCMFDIPPSFTQECITLANGRIPATDSSGTVSFPLTISSYVGSVFSVKVLGLHHTWMGDISLYLEEPGPRPGSTGATQYKLFDRSGSSQNFAENNYLFVSPFNENGNAWVGTPPETGVYAAVDDIEASYFGSGAWKLVFVDSAPGDVGGLDEWCLTYNSGSTCTPSDKAKCSEWASCNKTSGDAVCTCKRGFEDVSGGNGTACADINECLNDNIVSDSCHFLAECVNSNGSFACVCPDGFVGDGTSCSNNAWSIRAVLNIPDVRSERLDPVQLELLKLKYAVIITQDTKLMLNDSIVETLPVFQGKWQYGSPLLGIQHDEEQPDTITFFALFETESAATQALDNLPANPDWSLLGATSVADEPKVYRWTGGSTSDPIQPPPTGLSVDVVWFDTTCLQSGCWTIDVTYTAGIDDFNVFFLPRAEASDSLSYDAVYTAAGDTWPGSPAATFLPSNHPCTSFDFQTGATSDLPASVTSCCIPEFLDMYRPVAAFETALDAIPDLDLNASCSVGERLRPVNRSTLPGFVAHGQTADAASNTFNPPASSSAVSGVFVDGVFSGMSSYIEHLEITDSFVGIYKARLFVDEVELRTLAGQLRGTVGVEHTVDTFVGLANFGLTGSRVLDTSAVQVNIHLEKTSYFSVSTHGTNDYTFLEYVNLRLVAIYNQDNDFSGLSESGDGTVRTDSSDAAHYIQVTFTLGPKYGVNENDGLVPLDSVRAGKGTFYRDVEAQNGEAGMVHKCLQWTSAPGYAFPRVESFNSTLRQDCAPGASMCVSPASIPDSFVSFNIPLGVDWYETTPQGQAETLSNNVFVSMVISAVDTVARSGMTISNEGEAPWQMKTTLTASIPVVAGGVNIFCDGITSKTDLKDVANADIVVGSAASPGELSRLRIKTNIASTQLSTSTITEIDSASIESGLMTLVLKGNASYFQANTGIQGVSLELEDVITIHIMEDDGTGADASVVTRVGGVMDLITSDPADNSDTNGLITDGYALNDAFYFTIDRAAQRAHLEPSAALLGICAFNPPRPAVGSSQLETCVVRRDVQYRDYPWRVGAKSTAMEICANVNPNKQGTEGARCPTSTGSDESLFFASILGDNDNARQLAVDYAAVIADEYQLNGRYRRAYWINPGYEWTPTQSGGSSFTVSQKLFLFALVTLDEGIVTTDAGHTITDSTAFDTPGPKLTRRMLLQSTSDSLRDAQATVNADVFSFDVTPKSIMASAFEVPEDRVALYTVELQLTREEACMTPVLRQNALRATFLDYVSLTATTLNSVQVVSMAVDNGGESCDGSRRSLLGSYSSATATVVMMLVFQAGGTAVFNLEAFSQLEGILHVTPDERNSPKVLIDSTFKCEESSKCGVPNPGNDDSSSSNDTALIAGVAAGVGGGLLVGVAALLYTRSKTETVIAQPLGADVNSLKAQLQDEV